MTRLYIKLLICILLIQGRNFQDNKVRHLYAPPKIDLNPSAINDIGVDLQQTIMEIESSNKQQRVNISTFKLHRRLLGDVKNMNMQPRIIGGMEVKNRSMFPFQASLRYKKQHFCGGVIIKINKVLTAAHCSHDRYNIRLDINKIVVVVGDLKINEPTDHTKMYSVKRMHVHYRYHRVTMLNDIALIEIFGLFEWNDYVSPIPLATRKPSTATECLISGWGSRRKQPLSISNLLHYAKVPVLDNTQCKRYITSYLPSRHAMFCAGVIRGGVDSCKGDSGGPLVCNNELAGIISWGIGCAERGHPGIYVDISRYIDWVETAKSNSTMLSSSFTLLLVSDIIVLILRLIKHCYL